MPLFLSTVFSSLIAMVVMLFVLYAPRLFGRRSYDVLRAMGSAVTGRVDAASTALGAVIFTIGGLIFGYLYGLLARTMMNQTDVFSNYETGLVLLEPVNVAYPFVGFWIGGGHGVALSLLLTIIVIEHHPVESFRGRMALVPLVMISHIVYGGVVMLFHHQFLQMFLN